MLNQKSPEVLSVEVKVSSDSGLVDSVSVSPPPRPPSRQVLVLELQPLGGD